MSAVPDYALRQAAGVPGGVRLSKWEKFVAPVAHYEHDTDTSGWIPWDRRQLPAAYSEQGARNMDALALNIALKDTLEFDNEEFRFWAIEMMEETPVSAVCRFCETHASSRDGRIKHKDDHSLNEDPCTISLVKAYDLLLKDSKCLICDTWTGFKRWGVPLCHTSKCEDAFKFGTEPPDALVQAILLSAKRNS